MAWKVAYVGQVRNDMYLNLQSHRDTGFWKAPLAKLKQIVVIVPRVELF